MLVVAAVVVCGRGLGAQVVGVAQAAPVGRAAEAEVAGMARKDAYTVTMALPGGHELEVREFEFEGEVVPTNKLHFKELSPGVVEVTSVAYSVGEWRFRVRDRGNYYGLGERFDALNHAHTVVKSVSQDTGGPKGSSSYKPVPFFMSTTGYGMWVDTTAEATFDMNASSDTDVIVDVTAEKLRLVLFAGPEFPVILERFTGLAGRAILPPYWAFAPWKARDFHQNDAQVKEDVDKTRELGLPASVILIDSPWATTYNSYKFNPKQFDDAPGMVKYVHDHGYKLVLWHTPWINSQSDAPHEAGFEGKIAPMAENYAEAAGNGYFVKNADGTPYVGRWWKGTGSMIDFTNPSAKRWWQDQVRQAIHAGADGFKDDDGEGSYVGRVKFADGTDPRLMRNRYAVLYNNAMEELIQKDLKGNGVLFARSVSTDGHAGANGIGMLWGGDNEANFSKENGLPTVVTAGLGAGLSGMPLWTSDLGGYEGSGAADPVLFQRWTEYAAMSPVMEVMSESNRGPWDYGEQALATYRKFAVLHMSLFPYRYAAAQEAAKTGMPLMRSLVLGNQDDRRAREAKDEYMLGPDLLVAPVLDEGTTRPVYLPVGEWVDYWAGAQVSGGKTVVVEAAVDSLPLWVRAGAVIAKIPEDVMTLVPQSESGNTQVRSMDDRRVYEIYGGGESAESKRTDFEGRVVTRTGNRLVISGDSAAHVVVRWRFAKVRSVTVGGAEMKVQTGEGGSYVEFDHLKESVVSWQ
jgi:alpha-D-xyloside xylohydrolase